MSLFLAKMRIGDEESMSLMKEEELFNRALELAENERAAFLRSACGEQVDLRERVENLLAASPGRFRGRYSLRGNHCLLGHPSGGNGGARRLRLRCRPWAGP